MTMGDKIRSMNNKELSKFLCDNMNDSCDSCVGKKFCHINHTGLLDYLNQEVSNEENKILKDD